MHETEIKILEIDRTKVEAALVSLGAKIVFDGVMHALYYDFADHSIGKKRGTLRLRKEGEKTLLTVKKHIDAEGAKVREEREVEVSDFNVMCDILESIGLSAWLEMMKHRTTYELAEMHFELDKYHGDYEYIPEFLEIEGTDIEKVLAYAELLGFSKQECRPWDAVELADYYSRARRNA
jgi:predicted adenylyl cyclase CyaB